MSEIYLSVIIPVRNEAKCLPDTLLDIGSYLSKQDYEFEIIVVDNASVDSTPDVVRELIGRIENLRLIEVGSGGGKGRAIKIGMLSAKGEYRVFIDADNSVSINQVEKMRLWFERGYDVVIGSRDVKGAVWNSPESFLKKVILRAGLRVVIGIIIGVWGILDTRCGFKGFAANAVKDIFPKTKIKGTAFDQEVLAIAQKKKYKIKEIPIYWRNDPKRKIKLRKIIEIGFDLLGIRWNLITRRYNHNHKKKSGNQK